MLTHVEMITRIALSAIMGGAIGLERDLHGRQAGLRTHVLVSMGSATFMIVSCQFVPFQGYDPGVHVEADVSRIAANVVTGIGFLAGGAILKTGLSVQGLTTAAALWLVAAIGLCIGGGMYPEGGAVTLMGLITLTIFRFFEDKDDRTIKRYISLTAENVPQQVSGILGSLKEANISFSDFDYEYQNQKREVRLTFEAHIPLSLGAAGLAELMQKQTGIHSLHINQRHHEKI